MHFWIDKRNQGFGFNGRQLLPSTLHGCGPSQRFLHGGLHPKPMVTPVHRFQSIESVANNNGRYTRCSNYHLRTPLHRQSTVHFNGAVGSRNNPQTSQAIEMLITGQNNTAIRRPNNIPTAKFKCGVWFFFAILTFLVAGAKYYFHGVNIGVEAFAFCSLLVIFLIIGGLISLYEAITASANVSQRETTAPIVEPHQENIDNNQVPSTLMPPVSAELPPPPYHIAIMLPLQNTSDSIQVIQDSPPPSYEKVVN